MTHYNLKIVVSIIALRASHHHLDHILVAISDIRLVLDILIITGHIVIKNRVGHCLVEKTTEVHKSSTMYTLTKTMEDSTIITTIANTQS